MGEAYGDLLQDWESTRHTTLQNQSAIDFLLLVHGHGCQDFEGLCCFNLSSHAESISKSIQLLKKQVQKIKMEGKIIDCFNYFLGQGGFKGWGLFLVKSVLRIFVIILIVLLMFSCFMYCLKKAVREAVLINKESRVVEADGPTESLPPRPGANALRH